MPASDAGHVADVAAVVETVPPVESLRCQCGVTACLDELVIDDAFLGIQSQHRDGAGDQSDASVPHSLRNGNVSCSVPP